MNRRTRFTRPQFAVECAIGASSKASCHADAERPEPDHQVSFDKSLAVARLLKPGNLSIEVIDLLIAAMVADDLTLLENAHILRRLPLFPVRDVRLVFRLGFFDKFLRFLQLLPSQFQPPGGRGSCRARRRNRKDGKKRLRKEAMTQGFMIAY